MKNYRFLALMLAFLLLFSMVACVPEGKEDASDTEDTSADIAEDSGDKNNNNDDTPDDGGVTPPDDGGDDNLGDEGDDGDDGDDNEGLVDDSNEEFKGGDIIIIG